jgi:hypothetical protein
MDSKTTIWMLFYLIDQRMQIGIPFVKETICRSYEEVSKLVGSEFHIIIQ